MARPPLPRPVVVDVRDRVLRGETAYSYTVCATFDHGHEQWATFYTAVGHISLVTEGIDIPVQDPGRFGPELNPQWIHNFYGIGEQ